MILPPDSVALKVSSCEDSVRVGIRLRSNVATILRDPIAEQMKVETRPSDVVLGFGSIKLSC